MADTYKLPKPDRSSYVFGWISALPREGLAATLMFDQEHAKQDQRPGDKNAYRLGRIGDFNVVQATLPRPSEVPAAIAMTHLQHAFPQVRFTLLVGIGGGAPDPDDREKDIRLGDVVVSWDNAHGGVIKYNHGKIVDDGEFVENGHLDKPDDRLVTAAADLRITLDMHGNQGIKNHIEAAKRNATNPTLSQRFAFPGHGKDVLFLADYKGPEKKHGKTCNACDKTQAVLGRPQREGPFTFYGTIGSSNVVMKHGPTRDKYRDERGILCFEMEAAGMMNNYHCLVIRGISDYADVHKNDIWQDYAAITAAAYAKALIRNMARDEVGMMTASRNLGQANK